MKPPPPALLTRIEAILIVALHALEDQSEPVPILCHKLAKGELAGPDRAVHDFDVVHKIEQLLIGDEDAPDHSAYLIETMNGEGSWANATGRIQAVQAACRAFPWQRAYAVARTVNPRWSREHLKVVHSQSEPPAL